MIKILLKITFSDVIRLKWVKLWYRIMQDDQHGYIKPIEAWVMSKHVFLLSAVSQRFFQCARRVARNSKNGLVDSSVTAHKLDILRHMCVIFNKGFQERHLISHVSRHTKASRMYRVGMKSNFIFTEYPCSLHFHRRELHAFYLNVVTSGHRVTKIVLMNITGVIPNGTEWKPIIVLCV